MSDIFTLLTSPIQKAQEYVKNDDWDSLKQLLVNPKKNVGDLSNLISEETYVNEQIQENLLHYAVYECAAKCVQHLTRTPYLWSADRSNLISRTAAQIAEKRGYLPVWYPLLANSCHAGETWSSTKLNNVLAGETRSVSRLLLYPHEFVERQMDPNMEWQSFYEVRDKSNNTDAKLSADNMALLFELLLSTPELLVSGMRNALTFWPWSHHGHATVCKDYPICLEENRQWFAHIDDLLLRFQRWASHRLMTGFSFTDSGKQIDGTDLSPMPLDEQCRLLIRRLLVLKLYEESKKLTGTGALNYAHSVNQLPVPRLCKNFLAFQELWPAVPRDQVPLIRARHPRVMTVLNPHPVLWRFQGVDDDEEYFEVEVG